MEAITKKQLLETMGIVYEQAKDSKLDVTLFDKIDAQLECLSGYFNVNKPQSLFISLVFTLNYKGDTVDLADLIRYIDCNPLRLLDFSDDFDMLVENGILKKQKSNHHLKLAMTNDQFTVNELVSEAIIKSKPMPSLMGVAQYVDVLDLMEAIYNMGYKVALEEMSAFELRLRFESIMDENTHLNLIHTISLMGLDTTNKYLILYLVWKYLTGSQTVDIDKAANGMFNETADKIKFKQTLIDEKNDLIKMALIEVMEGDYINDAEIKLTDKALQLIQESGLTLLVKKKPKNIIIPNEITAKELFFNGSEKSQLQMLASLLDDTKLREVQDRLAGKALPQGVTVLFHGYPGTGKTESVYQLAKQTNRTIMKVDISQSKSMWFGESEKVIKRIFTEYRAYAKECDMAPILLFNEADAIISKRKDSSSSNVAHTENAIQNIILEELENFNGIFMATTNLVTNIDTAFDRRFLFKVEFVKPDINAKAMIWQSKLPWLLPEDCKTLAKQFDFSGGQIDNVVRKVEVDSIINDNVLTYESVVVFCLQEVMVRECRGKVGF